MVRKVTKTKGVFSSENAILKQVFLATQNAKARWNTFAYGWPLIRLQLEQYFNNRLIDTVQ
jgi:transposase-like protein